MPTELKMPALSPTMEEGTLAKWLVKEGDDGQIGRHPGRDRDRQGDDGVRGGRRRHDRQDPGARRHGRSEGRHADRGAGGRGRGRQRRGCPCELRHRRRDAAPAPAPKAARTCQTLLAAAPGTGRNSARCASRCRLLRGRRASGSRRARWRGVWPRRRASILPTLKGSGPGGRIVRADLGAAAGGRRRAPRRSQLLAARRRSRSSRATSRTKSSSFRTCARRSRGG